MGLGSVWDGKGKFARFKFKVGLEKGLGLAKAGFRMGLQWVWVARGGFRGGVKVGLEWCIRACVERLPGVFRVDSVLA